MNIQFQPITAQNAGFLWEMLYQAIFVPPGSAAPPREIIRQAELARYAQGWGRAGDLGLYACLEDGEPVGAAWLRLWQPGNRGYGWVDDETPELSLALLPEMRGQGLGSRLLAQLLDAARKHFARVSLSVSADNPAVRLYQRAGFRRVAGDEHTWIMLLDWKDLPPLG